MAPPSEEKKPYYFKTCYGCGWVETVYTIEIGQEYLCKGCNKNNKTFLIHTIQDMKDLFRSFGKRRVKSP